MKKLYTCIFAVFIASNSPAQIPVNNPIDTTDVELVKAVDFLRSYLNEFTAGHIPEYSKYWSAEDCKEYRQPDQLVNGITPECPVYRIGEPDILYARPENGYVHIKTMFAWVDTNSKVSVMSITNHYIQQDENKLLRFISPFRIGGKDWNTTASGNITYHYPPYHRFDEKKAKMLARQIGTLERDWDLKPIKIRYYFADTKDELDHARGFDFTVAMGNRDKPSGMSDDADNIIYCGGLGENYFHEVVHIYLNHHYQQSPMREGIAVFYGGSMGHELFWHLRRLNTYLQQHKNIDLDRLSDDFYYMDNFTNPFTTITGMLCLDAYNRNGLAALKRMMDYTSLDDLIEKEYKVQKGNWNEFLRKMIDDNSRAKQN
ncbi:MAG: hypothetical protein JWQ38_1755 [Flavipsychrobacter sp.]|nr:hypothetical protein [Flavipsychrobacter sp.]